MKINFSSKNKKQANFVNDMKSRRQLFLGGRGSGKTYGGAMKALKLMTIPGSVGMVVCPTYKQLMVAQNTLWDLMWSTKFTPEEETEISRYQNDISQPLWVMNYNKAEKDLLTVFDTKVHFRSGQNPDALRGYNLTWYWVDEPALVNREVVMNLDMAHRRQLPNQTCISWLTTTPKGHNWLYEDLGAFKVYTATTYDNAHNLPSDFIESLPQEGTWRLQEVMGEFVEMEGLVFTSADYRVRELDDIKEVHALAYGMDFGYSSPASVISLATVTSKSMGKVTYVYDELYANQMTTQDLFKSLPEKRFDAPDKGYFADPSLPGNIEELRRLGLNIRKANNDVLYGIDQIKLSNLVISPACQNLLAELQQYTWAANGKPQKVFDHAIDAMRYGIVGLVAKKKAVAMNVPWFQTDQALYERLAL